MPTYMAVRGRKDFLAWRQETQGTEGLAVMGGALFLRNQVEVSERNRSHYQSIHILSNMYSVNEGGIDDGDPRS